jgi:hypothetical protein
MAIEAAEAHRACVELDRVANRLLGPETWFLVSAYGRVMTGPYVGKYVNALPPAEGLALVDALGRGERVPVHLMHRHRSGSLESSDLCFRGQRLTMLFADREEPGLTEGRP